MIDIPALSLLLSNIAPGDRLEAAETLLRSEAGQARRAEIGDWISRLVPVEFLVPEVSRPWRPLVRDAMEFVFSHLSERRLAAKLVEQAELAPDTPPEVRLIRLISKMPGLQKLGQVLARHRRLPPSLRHELTKLENGMSDVAAADIHDIIVRQLGKSLERYAVKIDASILSEASVSAVIRFTWKNPGRERERGVFKVLKPYVPDCFAEDMTLLQSLGTFLAGRDRGYGFAVREVEEMLAEVRLLLERELDLSGEQQTLREAERMYRSSIGVRVPHVIPPLSTGIITAMSEETGVKVTDACPRSPLRRYRIAVQLIEALIAVPLFAPEDVAVFHADPHPGNLFYDAPNRELVILDWALAQRLSRESRRQLVLLAVMMILRDQERVIEAIHALSRSAAGRKRGRRRVIEQVVKRFFDRLPANHSPGTLDAMRLLDEIALHGVKFPPPLFMFRKIVFTLDSVLREIAGSGVRIDAVIARAFLTRWVASFGMFHAPLGIKDLGAITYRLRPCFSWLDTQAEDEMTATGPISATGPTPPMISGGR